MKTFVWAGVMVGLLLAATGVRAEDLKLRRVVAGTDGAWQMMFTLTEGDQVAYDDPSLLTTELFEVLAGSSDSDLAPLSIEGVSLTTVNAESLPVRVVLLLPNTDLFNGIASDPARPDASGMRAAVGEALQRLPSRSDVSVWAALYNVNVDPLPESDGTRTAELAQELLAPAWVSAPGQYVEDPARAINLGYSAFCRSPGEAFSVHLIIVTSSLTVHASDVLGGELERIRTLLEEDQSGRLVVETIVYNPAFEDGVLLDPTSDPVQFANGITPRSGTSRLVNSEVGFRAAMSQVMDEIEHSYLLRFSAPPAPDANAYVMQLRFNAGATTITSNARRIAVP